MADFKKSMEMLGRIVDLNRPPEPQRIIRASDAFSPFIDKAVGVTMADRTKAEQFGKFKGGARFPWLQNVDPAYEGQTWGFGKKGMATRMHGQFEAIPEEELLISTILGKRDMLKSNPEVFDDLVKQYKKGMKSGLLTDELRAKTNKVLAGIPADDTGKLMFGPDVDIADPAFFKSLDTFDKRREVGNIFGGVGVGGKKGQLFDYDAAIKKYNEPSLYDAPNMSIGPRIFTLSGTKAERPDLNAAYRHVVGGLDLGVDYTPVPRNIFLKDYHDEFMSRGKVPGWLNITQSSSMPYQKITDEWLQHLKDRGYAEGGEVEHMQSGGIKTLVGGAAKIDAPSIMTRSGLSDLADYLKKREGMYGVRRLERAADEIPRLGDLYDQDALRSAFSGDNARALMTMNPADFEKYAAPLSGQELSTRIYRPYENTSEGVGFKRGPEMSYDDYIKNLIGVQRNLGFEDVPFLQIDKKQQGSLNLPFIAGHEGRHRSRALNQAGEQASLVQLRPRAELREPFPRRESEEFIDAIRKEMALTDNKVKPEQYWDNFAQQEIKRKMVQLPDLYADGGQVEHMQSGGLKGMVGAGAKLLSKAERDANLTKFLEDSALKQRLYHGSKQMRFNPDGSRVYAPDEGYKELLPSGTGELNSALNTRPPAVFLSPNPEFANQFATSQVNNATPAVYPVHAKVKNPFDYANQAHMDALEREYIKTYIDSRVPAEGESLFDFKKANAALTNDLRRTLESAKSHDANWNTLEDMKIQDIIRKLGHDAFYVTENGVKNIGVYDPKMIKSATGNQGTYDITTTELNKAKGGEVEHMQSGGLKNLASGATKVFSQAERDANLANFLKESKIKNRAYHATNQDIKRFDPEADPRTENSSNISGWFTGDPEFANDFASQKFRYWKTQHKPWEEDPNIPSGVNILPVHLAMKNPFNATNLIKNLSAPLEMSEAESVAKALGLKVDDLLVSIPKTIKFKKTGAEREHMPRGFDIVKSEAATDAMKKMGHDGVIALENSAEVYAPFNSTQIKSATGNRGTYDITNPDITKAQGGQVERMQAGGLKTGIGLILPEVENAIAGIKEANRMPVVPMPNRWFLQPEKFPQVQGMVDKVLQRSGLPRESFTSGAYVNPITGDILDRKIFEDVGVAINPATNRPMMSAGKEAGIEELEKELGGMTRSNLVRKGLFKRTGGDPLLDDINFLATIERSGMGHKYGLATEYGSPTQMFNTGKSGNPTLRPTSRGDVFGVGDVVGQIQLGKGPMHDVYEKLFVAPQGMDVPGVKLHKFNGGNVKTPVGGHMKHTSFEQLREGMGLAEGGDIMHKLVKYAAAGGEIDDLQHTMAKQYLETIDG